MLRQKVNHQGVMINWDINKSCRVCLTQNDNMKTLYESKTPNEMCRKLTYCTSFEIKLEDDMPLNICLPCFDNLEVAFNFKKKFETSYVILQDKHKNKVVNKVNFDKIGNNLDYTGNELDNNKKEGKLTNQLHQNFINKNKSTAKSKYLCNFCGYLYASLSALKSHLITHSDNLPYSCNLCNKKFKSRASKSFHLKTHSGERKHCCEKCGKSYFNSSGLKYHMQSHETNKQLSGNLFTCKECDKGFKSDNDLKTHVILHTGDFPFICDICDRGFNRSSNYKMHMRRHSGIKAFICDICGFALFTFSALNIHKRSHTSEKLYSCEICDGQFATCSGLNRHKKRLHLF